MQDIKQNLGDAIRKARTELGLSQERLAEDLGMDTRTILNIEAGRGNPTLEVMCSLVTYLKISVEPIFYSVNETEQPHLQKLLNTLNDCSEQEAQDLLPMVRYLIDLMRK